ncbi:MAG: DUF3237 domain-containing protein [Desulfobacterales bacterium]
MTELNFEFLCECTGELEDPQAVGPTPKGIRMIYPVKGGSISGPELNGTLLPFGADWLLMRPDGACEIDVRITIKTHDDAFIHVWYRGILLVSPEVMARVQAGEEVDPSEYYFRTTPVFETGSEKYGWLNRIVCVGIGKIAVSKVVYRIYRIL